MRCRLDTRQGADSRASKRCLHLTPLKVAQRRQRRQRQQRRQRLQRRKLEQRRQRRKKSPP